MTPKIKILHLEDNINDHELVKETLLLNDIDCEIVHADNKDDFIKFLEEITFDIILADFNLPSFDGFTALDYCKSVAKDTPFIFISGVLGEELAIETLKRGATDYVIKSRLERLVPAVTRALQEKEDKAQRILLERELVELEQVVNELKSTYDQLTRRVRGFLKIELPTLNYSIVDKFLEDLSGYNIKDWKEQPNFISTIIHPDYKEYYTENVDQLKDGFVPKMLEYKIVRKDMAERWWLQFNIGAFDVNGQLTSVSAVIVDNTVDKETQVKYQNLFENALTGMYRSDIDTGEIIEANERMAELLGCQSVEELKNYTANDFYVSSELRRNLVDQLYEQESYEENLMQLKKLDGTIIWVSESSRIYPDEGYIEGMLIDVTDRKKAEDALMRDRKIFQIIAESAVLSNTSEELCQKIIKDLIEILEFCCGSIRLLNDDNKLKPIAVVGKNLDLNNVPDIDLDDEKSMIANIARTKEEVFITDINKNNILSNLKIDLCSNYNAIISYPILSVDEVIGIIELYSPSIKENLSEDKPLFDAIADMLASAIIHRKAEEDLKDSEERFRAFAEQSLIGVALINKSGNFIFMNDEILRILEVSKYDIYNKSINEIQEGIMENLEVRNHIEYVIRKVIAEQITIIEEFRIISRSNKTKWLSTHFTPIRIKDDYAIAVIILEITDEKQAQMTVERERQAFHFLAEAIVNAKSIADLCQKIVMGICKTFNFDNGTFRIFNKEKETLEVIAAVLKDETKRQLIKTLDLQDTTYINTYVARTKDAVFAPDVSKHPIARQYDNRLQRFNAKANITYPILGSDKALLGTIQLVADEPKELPENDKFFFETIVRFFAAALEKMWTEEEQNRLTTIITHSDQVIISADANSNIIYANPATKNVFGYDPNEILGKPLSSLAPTGQQGLQREKLIELQKSDSIVFEAIRKHKNGTLIPVLINLTANRNENGEIISYNGILVDITNMKRLEESLRERYHEFEVLNKIISAGYRAQTKDQFLNFLLNTLLSSLDFSGGAVYLIDEIEKKAELDKHIGIPKNIVDNIKSVSVNSPQFKRLFVEGQTIILDDFKEIEEQHSKSGINTLISVPFFSKERINGALSLISNQKRKISESDVRLLEAIGRDVGTVLAKFKAEEELKDRGSNLQLIFDSLDVILIIADATSLQILETNITAQKRLGYSEAEFKKLTIFDLHPINSNTKCKDIMDMVAIDKSVKMNMEMTSKEGNQIKTETTIQYQTFAGKSVYLCLNRILE